MFGKNKYDEREDGPHVADIIRKAREAEARQGLPHTPEPKRPGETPPRPFVGNTLKQLNSVMEKYSAERDLLAQDIAKLQEEHRQVVLALEAVAKAINVLETPQQPGTIGETLRPDIIERSAMEELERELAKGTD